MSAADIWLFCTTRFVFLFPIDYESGRFDKSVDLNPDSSYRLRVPAIYDWDRCDVYTVDKLVPSNILKCTTFIYYQPKKFQKKIENKKRRVELEALKAKWGMKS